MKLCLHVAWFCLGAAGLACSPVNDVVFETLALEGRDTPVVFAEGAGAVELTLRLSAAPRAPIQAAYGFLEVEAQSACKQPDFAGTDASIVWPAGVREVRLPLWIGDDTLAELDERFTVSLEPVDGSALLGSATITVVIADDDRSAIIDARADFGVVPGEAADQSSRLQAAFDRAAALGRGVVVMAPGNYEMAAVALHPGTTLAARGVRWQRPSGSALDAVTLTSRYQSSEDSADTLVEGLTIDGRRDAQGDYENNERSEAHLMWLSGNAASSGRLRVAVENVTLTMGTASGVFLGPQTNTTLCRLRGSDLWRDIVTLRGGGSRVDVSALSADATKGTTGMWFDGQPAGFDESHRIEVQITDARLASGDLEIEAYAGSRIDITRLEMMQAPFRLLAPDARVRIADSVLQFGPARPTHNWVLPHDVEVARTTLVATRADGDLPAAQEPARRLAAANVRWDPPSVSDELPALLPFAPPPHRLLFDDCSFRRAPDLDAEDVVYAIENIGTQGQIEVRVPTLGPGIAGLYAPQ
jgi:hypothetical protein